MAETAASVQSQSSVLDPITLEVLWSRLISIIEESESTLVRTSFSPIVGEADDHSAALLDTNGELVAQTHKANTGFIGTLGKMTRTLLEYFPKETLKPGDVLICNDPWICCGHLNDINIVRPIFYRGKLVAFTSNVAHMTDVGGRNGAEAVDLFEEGLRIMPSKLYDGGIRNETIYAFLRANSRLPLNIIGDLNAQLAAAEVADRRLVEMIEEYELQDIDELTEEIQRRTEQVMRDAIARLPDGDYYGDVLSDGFDETLMIKLKLSIHADSMTLDFAGTSDQIDRAINCPLNLTYAETVWAVRAALAPDLPNTDGALRPITITAPEGCILNPRFPAAVYQRTIVVHNTQAAVFKALSELVPHQISPANMQANSGCIWSFRFKGRWSENWRPDWETQDYFVSAYLGHGGQGASGVKDGQHCMAYTDNSGNMPIEVVENRMPVIFLCKRLRSDSGGAGQFRGGCGQDIHLKVLSDTPIQFGLGSGDKMRNPPYGLCGGLHGGNGFLGRNGEPVFPPRFWFWVNEGEIVNYQPPGGGGWGNPFERDPLAVLADILDGVVSVEAASRLYGVSIERQAEINWDETRQLRSNAPPIAH